MHETGLYVDLMFGGERKCGARWTDLRCMSLAYSLYTCRITPEQARCFEL